MFPKKALQTIRFGLKLLKEVFYSKRDGIQESTEKILNFLFVEIIVFFLLLVGCFAIGFGTKGMGNDWWSWQMAGVWWVLPCFCFFIINVFFTANYFSVIKRKRINKEEIELFFPERLNKLILINAFLGWFFPFSIYAKTMFYKHFLYLYKRDLIPWLSQHDTRKERIRKQKQRRQRSREELKRYLKISGEDLQVTW